MTLTKYKWRLSPDKLVVGLTGSPASGKSEVLSRFGELGAVSVSADGLVAAQLEKGRPGYKAVVKKYGKAALSADKLDKIFLAEKVFFSPKDLRWLESVLHPLVLDEARRIINGARGVVVFEVPLLFEKEMEDWFDLTICVRASRPVRLARAKQKGWSLRDFRSREAAQFSQEKKCSLAGITLENSGGQQALSLLAEKIYAVLKTMKGTKKGA